MKQKINLPVVGTNKGEVVGQIVGSHNNRNKIKYVWLTIDSTVINLYFEKKRKKINDQKIQLKILFIHNLYLAQV